jgi:putative endonuclease
VVTAIFTTYVLYSEKWRKIYIGESSDLPGRMISHNKLGKGWTSRYRPWTVLHTEVFPSKSQAVKREKQLKTARGRKWIWELITSSGSYPPAGGPIRRVAD